MSDNFDIWTELDRVRRQLDEARGDAARLRAALVDYRYLLCHWLSYWESARADAETLPEDTRRLLAGTIPSDTAPTPNPPPPPRDVEGPRKCNLYQANCPEPSICEVEGECCAGDVGAPQAPATGMDPPALRCPFCSVAGEIRIKVMPDCGGETYEIANCDNCGAEGPARYVRRALTAHPSSGGGAK